MLAVDLKLLRRHLLAKTIDTVIWASISAIIVSYLLNIPSIVAQDILAGSIASSMFIQVFAQAMMLLMDIKNTRHIDFLLTTPVPAWIIFIKITVGFFMPQFLISISTLPVIKFIAGDLLPMRLVSWGAFIAVMLLSNLFFALATTLVCTLAYWHESPSRVWARILFPLWFIGCFQFSWQTLYAKSALGAYLDLLNPFTYVMEGTRAALLGQAGYLPIWACLGGLVVLGSIVAYVGFRRLQKILDFV